MTKRTEPIMTEEEMMKKLKEILLKDDRAKINKIEHIVETKADLSQRVSPIVEEHIEQLKQNFPDQYLQVVDHLMEEKIKSSSEDILNTIYPVLGKMIKKYIAHQFQLLRESIDNQVKKAMKSLNFVDRLRAVFFGIKNSDVILANADQPQIIEIFAIQRDSGILLGSASVQQTIDQDLVAGMLTAIKAFVEDAFMGGEQNLGMIEYDVHKIYIQNFPAFYIAVAMSGSISAESKDRLNSTLLDFAEKEITKKVIIPTEASNQYLSERLEQYFIGNETQFLH